MLQNEDEKYSQIREKLRSLPKVKASDNFMVSLQHKINLIDAETRNLSSSIHKETHSRIQQGAFARFFGFQQRPWLIPALSFTVVIFLVLTVVYLGYFNTSSNTDQRIASTNAETITQNSAQNGNVQNNTGSTQEGGTSNNTPNSEQRIGNTDSQPGNDEGLLATNDGRLGKTDSYNNREKSTPKLDVMETGNFITTTTNETPSAPIENSANLRGGRTSTTEVIVDGVNTESKPNGTKDDGKIKSAMKPFDEESGISVDDKKKETSKNPRNIREVNNIGKTALEELMDALNGE